jgi:hypothetical protein
MKTEFIVKVDRIKLLDSLRSNRKLYSEILYEAKIKYIEKMRIWLGDCIADLDSAGPDKALPSMRCPHTPPPDYLSDYDTAIGLLADAVDTVIEISEEQHAKFVRNRWDWMPVVKARMISYTSRASELPD